MSKFKYKLFRTSLTGILLATAISLNNQSQDLYAQTNNSGIEVEMDDLEKSTLLAAKAGSKTSYKTCKNGTHKVIIKKSSGKKTVKTEKCKLVPQLKYIDNENGTHTIKFYKKCLDCNYKTKIYKSILECDFESKDNCEYCNSDKNELEKIKKLTNKQKKKNGFKIISVNNKSNKNSTHKVITKIKLKNGKKYKIVKNIDCKLVTEINYIDNNNKTHKVETFANCPDCGYKIKVSENTENCNYINGECEDCHNKYTNENTNNPVYPGGGSGGSSGGFGGSGGSSGGAGGSIGEEEKPHTHIFTVSSTKLISNNDGTHQVETHYSCSCGETKVTTEENVPCEIAIWESLDETYEKGSCACGYEPKRKHVFNEKSVSYTTNNDGTHQVKTEYSCSCGETKVTTEENVPCEIAIWESLDETYEKGSCACGYEPKREHTLDNNYSTKWQYVGDSKHSREIGKKCTTCDYKNTVTETIDCDLKGEKTTASNGLDVVVECSGCYHGTIVHTHKFDKRKEKIENDTKNCYNEVEYCIYSDDSDCGYTPIIIATEPHHYQIDTIINNTIIEICTGCRNERVKTCQETPNDTLANNISELEILRNQLLASIYVLDIYEDDKKVYYKK